MIKLRKFIDTCIKDGIIPSREKFYEKDVLFDDTITDEYINELIDNNSIIYVDFILKHQEVSELIKEKVIQSDNKILKQTLKKFDKMYRLALYVEYLGDNLIKESFLFADRNISFAKGQLPDVCSKIERYITSHSIEYKGNIKEDVAYLLFGKSFVSDIRITDVRITDVIINPTERLYEIPVAELNKDFTIDPCYIESVTQFKLVLPNKQTFLLSDGFRFSKVVLDYILNNIDDYTDTQEDVIRFLSTNKFLYTQIERIIDKLNLYIAYHNIDGENKEIISKICLDYNDKFINDRRLFEKEFKDGYLIAKSSSVYEYTFTLLKSYAVSYDFIEKYNDMFNFYMLSKRFDKIQHKNRDIIEHMIIMNSNKFNSDKISYYEYYSTKEVIAEFL